MNTIPWPQSIKNPRQVDMELRPIDFSELFFVKHNLKNIIKKLGKIFIYFK